jgi:hypothetical protein
MRAHKNENDFRHLDLPLSGLDREYDLGWKFDLNTDGPLGWAADPFLLLYISFRMIDGERRTSGTLHYALTRRWWSRDFESSEDDRRLLFNLAMKQVPKDLGAVERGEEPQALSDKTPLFLSP